MGMKTQPSRPWLKRALLIRPWLKRIASSSLRFWKGLLKGLGPAGLWRPRYCRGRATLVLCLGIVLLVSWGCGRAVYYRRPTFVSDSAGREPPPSHPVGLNPLGELDICANAAPGLDAGERVLISRPELFTHEASLMISALRDALLHPEAWSQSTGLGQGVVFLLSEDPITSHARASKAGQACDALIVLWEPPGTRTLELTLPYPNQIPLRKMVRSRLCEFGNNQEQWRSLYLTVLGLLATNQNRYDDAVQLFDLANDIADGCLKLPGSEFKNP